MDAQDLSFLDKWSLELTKLAVTTTETGMATAIPV